MQVVIQDKASFHQNTTFKFAPLPLEFLFLQRPHSSFPMLPKRYSQNKQVIYQPCQNSGNAFLEYSFLLSDEFKGGRGKFTLVLFPAAGKKKIMLLLQIQQISCFAVLHWVFPLSFQDHGRYFCDQLTEWKYC